MKNSAALQLARVASREKQQRNISWRSGNIIAARHGASGNKWHQAAAISSNISEKARRISGSGMAA